MKRVTASEARRRWFSLLDEVIDGEVIAILRKGKRIILRRDDSAERRQKPPDYRSVLRVREPDRADSWHWDWNASGRQLELRDDES